MEKEICHEIIHKQKEVTPGIASLCLRICVSVCVDMCLAVARTVCSVLLICSIQKVIHHSLVDGEHEDSSSKNNGPADVPPRTKWRFFKNSL